VWTTGQQQYAEWALRNEKIRTVEQIVRHRLLKGYSPGIRSPPMGTAILEQFKKIKSVLGAAGA
jgi:hypothetical protein